MEAAAMTITGDRIKEYWRTFFPNDLTLDDLDGLIFSVSTQRLDDLIHRYADAAVSPAAARPSIAVPEEDAVLRTALEALRLRNHWAFFYEPVVKRHFHPLYQTLMRSSIVEDAAAIIHDILRDLCTMLHVVAFQTIIAETCYARKNNLLQGDTPAERGSFFSDVLLKSDAYRQSIYDNYPELARIMDGKARNIMAFAAKIITDTEHELTALEHQINNGSDLGVLKSMRLGAGDTHNGGKTVTALHFSSGAVIMYKPHDLIMEERYHALLQWLNRAAITDATRIMPVVKCHSKNDSGWMAFVEFRECGTIDELSRFYWRTGMLLCVLYTTNGMDIHHENIIAQGEAPMLIDLETFIHPDLSDEIDAASVIDKAVGIINDSITKNALLPTFVTSRLSDKVLDLGGLSAARGQESPFMTKFIENFGTDEVRVKMMNATIDARNNNPARNGTAADSKSFREDIIAGFKYLYRWICTNREAYRAMIEKLFGTVTSRVIYRPTNVYAQVLTSSYHPDLLTNHTDRFVFLHRLANRNFKNNHNVVRREIEDLLEGDIPYFTTRANATMVHGGQNGAAGLPLKKTTIQSIGEKISRMNDIDMFRQISIINSKMATEPFRLKTATVFLKNTRQKSSRATFTRFAETIADYLLERSIPAPAAPAPTIERTWFGSEEEEHGFTLFKPVNVNVYYGLAGIAFFFHFLGKISRKGRYTAITRQICTTIRRLIPEVTSEHGAVDLGAFSGLAGVAYLLFHIDRSNNDHAHSDEIVRILHYIDHNRDALKKFDVIHDAGILGVLVTMYRTTDDPAIIPAIVTLCDVLRAKIAEHTLTIAGMPGITWNKKGYAGYAHGNAGMVVLLYRLYTITGSNDLLTMIDEALSFEKALFVEKEKNWKRSIDEANFSCAWCHGAAGIVLSNVQLMRLGFENRSLHDELPMAIETTLLTGLGNDGCLCHGDMGNLSILKEAGIVLHDATLYQGSIATMQRFASALMDMMKTDTFKENENHGMMLGLAGIGYELLRAGREQVMPNILGLE